MKTEQTSKDVASIAGRILGGASYSDEEVMILAGSCLTQAPDKEVKGLPVAGYKPTQPQEAIAAVNYFK